MSRRPCVPKPIFEHSLDVEKYYKETSSFFHQTKTSTLSFPHIKTFHVYWNFDTRIVQAEHKKEMYK